MDLVLTPLVLLDQFRLERLTTTASLASTRRSPTAADQSLEQRLEQPTLSRLNSAAPVGTSQPLEMPQ